MDHAGGEVGLVCFPSPIQTASLVETQSVRLSKARGYLVYMNRVTLKCNLAYLMLRAASIKPGDTGS